VALVGTERIGDYFLDSFDMGIVMTLGGEKIGKYYFVRKEKITLMPGVPQLLLPLYTEAHGIPSEVGMRMPGIPIIWKNPDPSFMRYVLPCFRISREDPSPALERWNSLHLKHKGPAPDATPIQVQYGNTVLNGYDKYEEQNGAWPYDIPYTLTIEASGKSAELHVQAMLKYAMKIFEPYSVLDVPNSFGEIGKFNMFVEGPSDLGMVADIADSSKIYALSIRVSGNFDLSDIQTLDKTVTSKPQINVNRKE